MWIIVIKVIIVWIFMLWVIIRWRITNCLVAYHHLPCTASVLIGVMGLGGAALSVVPGVWTVSWVG